MAVLCDRAVCFHHASRVFLQFPKCQARLVQNANIAHSNLPSKSLAVRQS